MDMFELLDWKALALAGVITSIFIIAIVVTFDKFFKPPYRKKILTVVTSLIITVASIEINWIEWQSMTTGFFLTFGTCVLFYHYVGGQMIQKFFMDLKRRLGNE